MATRIRRNLRSAPHTSRIEELMKSISTSTSAINEHQTVIKNATAELYALMKAGNLTAHTYEDLIAELYRPSGKAINIIDPKALRELVKSDADYYSTISVSVTKAREIVPAKQLATITTTIPAKLGEETVRVKRG